MHLFIIVNLELTLEISSYMHDCADDNNANDILGTD